MGDTLSSVQCCRSLLKRCSGLPTTRCMKPAQDPAQRRAITGRLAGLLFVVGAIVAAPANELFTDPRVGQAARRVDLLAFMSGIVCLCIPLLHVVERRFHLLPIDGTL